MKRALGAVVFFLAGGLYAQQAGMQNAWDIRQTLAAIATHADRLAPLLDQVHPESWIASGAPEAYVAQAKSCRVQLKAVATDARNLSRNPEKLTDTLQILFRIRTLESLLGSLSEGIRKYHNPAMADLLTAAVAENGTNRDRLQQYALELATAKEQEFRVADEEAQRCRESISRQPSRERTAPPKPERNQ
jgi:hypothetical protein